MGAPHTVSLLLLTLVTGLISSSNYSCAAATSAECAATGTCKESVAGQGESGGKAAMDARRARMAALAAEINASIERRKSEEQRWDTQRQNAQREERALHEAHRGAQQTFSTTLLDDANLPEALQALLDLATRLRQHCLEAATCVEINQCVGCTWPGSVER